MRAIAAAVSLGVLMAVCACGRPASSQSEATPTELEIGNIEARTQELNDNTVIVELRWTLGQVPRNLNVDELLPVILFNERSQIRVTPKGDPIWQDGEVRFEAAVEVSKEAWRHGCWQAIYESSAGAIRDIDCINGEV